MRTTDRRLVSQCFTAETLCHMSHYVCREVGPPVLPLYCVTVSKPKFPGTGLFTVEYVPAPPTLLWHLYFCNHFQISRDSNSLLLLLYVMQNLQSLLPFPANSECNAFTRTLKIHHVFPVFTFLDLHQLDFGNIQRHCFYPSFTPALHLCSSSKSATFPPDAWLTQFLSFLCSLYSCSLNVSPSLCPSLHHLSPLCLSTGFGL